MINKILMVDDEKEAVDTAQRRLSDEGFQVFTAYDGQEACRIAKEKTPDLIIADAVMPVMNGFEFCKIIKKNEETKDIPIIVLLSKTNMEDSFLFLGIKDFLAKPYTMENLQKVIKNKLDLAQIMHLQKTKMMMYSSEVGVLERVHSLIGKTPQWGASYTSDPKVLIQEATLHTPDVILVDLCMHGMVPNELIEQMRAVDELRDTTILTYYIATAAEDDAYAHQAKIIEVQYLKRLAMDAGANEYIGPFNPETFVDLISVYRKDLKI